MKLLLGARVTVMATVAALTVHRVAPFVPLFHACREVVKRVVSGLLGSAHSISIALSLLGHGVLRYLNDFGVRRLSLLLWYCGQA